MKQLFFFLLIGAVCALKGGDGLHTEQIERVERGLMPPNPIEGDKGWTLEERMVHYGVPGVGIAVIENYRVVWYKVYGKADRETGSPVKPDTLFQAGSISKPVAAYGALKMVQNGQLTLDGNINGNLKSWQLPDNEFTKEQKVSLTHLLSHTGGLTIHGFPGYAFDEKAPTVVQVLDGALPTNTEAVRVDKVPGESWRYSGGGYTIVQLAMIDTSGKPFPELMHELVIGPIGMKHSTYAQPLPPELLKRAAAGILPDGSAVRGKRHTYPEMAAAGLWTTAEDLAKFAVDVQLALKGKSKVLSKDMTEKMLEPVVPHFGRGFGLSNLDGNAYFAHGGWDEGFCAQLTAHRDKGYGAVVMINSNHPAFMDEVIRGVALVYGWGGYQIHKRRPIPDGLRDKVTGRYRYNGDQAFLIEREGDRLFMRYYGNEAQELIHIGERRFVRRERSSPILFTEEDGQTVFNFVLSSGDYQSHRPIGDDVKVARQLLFEGTYEQGLAAYRDLKEKEDPTGGEGYLNNQGLSLVDEKLFERGIALLRIACDLYPESANTWDSLGYAYRKKGDKTNAVKYYRKSLAVTPGFPSAVEALKELENEK